MPQKHERERLIGQAVESLREQIDRDALRLITGSSNDPGIVNTTPADALTPGMVHQWAADWAKIARNMRRNDLTVVVDLAHEGAMLRHHHPVDGEFIECSWRQAQEIHENIHPLVLQKVRSTECAEFRLTVQFNGRVFALPSDAALRSAARFKQIVGVKYVNP